MGMQKVLLIVVAIMGAFGVTLSQTTKNKFVLNGKIEGLNDGLVYLYYNGEGNKRIKDSSQLQNGSFKFTGTISEPTMAFLQLKEEKRTELNSTSFFIEPLQMSVNAKFNDFKNANVGGSAVQRDYEALNKSKEVIRKEMQPAIDEYTAANEKYREAVKNKADEKTQDELKEKANDVRAKFVPFNQRQDKIDYEFFRTHPTSPVTAYMLRFHVAELPLDTLEMYYKNFGVALQQSSLGKEIGEEIRKMRNGSPGSIATNFTTTDINGNKLSLADYRGKYVLLDFWASWCVPCRKGNPHLKNLYAKYKSKGIEFIGIADDDRAEDAWRKAVDKDGIGMWKHVRRGLKFENGNFDRSTDISENFGIHTLPTKILIDPNGKIIGRYSEEEKPLDDKLREIFGE
jgi:thiol-disulfide isomerase/thioredoxin